MRRGLKLRNTLLAISLLPAGGVLGQFEDVRPEDEEKLTTQAVGFFTAMEPVVAKAAASTVEVRIWRKRVGYGTVIGEERVLTKWSDVRRAAESLSCRSKGGPLLAATVLGVYEEDDLALLEVKGLEAPPVEFANAAGLHLGSFLALVRPDGQAGGVGVVSVLPRSLRESDRAFLGVIMDTNFPGPGVRIERVEKRTGAAESGLRRGDVILAVNDQATNGNFELSAVLQKLDPGEIITLGYSRAGKKAQVEVLLGGRPKLPAISRKRMDTMNRMGGHRYSRVVDDFARVLQTDMQIQPEDCGGPVVDLEGRVVGIALARAGRIKSFVLPAESVQMLLAANADEPDDEGLALSWDEEGKETGNVREVRHGEQLERHMEDMERLLKQLDERR
jgi:serine protease Do